jgi:hypothetical protein
VSPGGKPQYRAVPEIETYLDRCRAVLAEPATAQGWAPAETSKLLSLQSRSVCGRIRKDSSGSIVLSRWISDEVPIDLCGRVLVLSIWSACNDIWRMSQQSLKLSGHERKEKKNVCDRGMRQSVAVLAAVCSALKPQSCAERASVPVCRHEVDLLGPGPDHCTVQPPPTLTVKFFTSAPTF